MVLIVMFSREISWLDFCCLHLLGIYNDISPKFQSSF